MEQSDTESRKNEPTPSQRLGKLCVIAFVCLPLLVFLLILNSKRIDARFLREKEQISAGMTLEEVKAKFARTGRLKEQPKQAGCSKGHVWNARGMQDGCLCPVCGASGKLQPDCWTLFPTKSVGWGSLYLSIKFDADGKLVSVSMSDM